MKFYIAAFILIILSFLNMTLTNSLEPPDFGQIWKKHSKNPLFSMDGETGNLNSATPQAYAILKGCAVKDNNMYKIYIPDFDGDHISISMVNSTNLDSGWNYYDSSPILSPGDPGSWDAHTVGNPMVIKDEGIYKMWYVGTNVPYTNAQWKIGYAESEDGMHWTKDTLNNPVLDVIPGTWEGCYLATPYVIRDGDTLKMWYYGEGNNYTSGIGYVKSTDGINWIRQSAYPILAPGLSLMWDRHCVLGPSVILNNGQYLMWYAGANKNIQTGFAKSADGINWDKDVIHNPILSVGAADQWDCEMVTVLNVFDEDSAFKMLYVGFNNTFYGVGLATYDKVSLIEKTVLNAPMSTVLKQNYPNPFNPITTIGFSIPKADFVSLKIYNLLGQEVATLVSEELNIGTYNYSWEAGSLPSGVYLYHLKASDFHEVKKMVLMR